MSALPPCRSPIEKRPRLALEVSMSRMFVVFLCAILLPMASVAQGLEDYIDLDQPVAGLRPPRVESLKIKWFDKPCSFYGSTLVVENVGTQRIESDWAKVVYAVLLEPQSSAESTSWYLQLPERWVKHEAMDPGEKMLLELPPLLGPDDEYCWGAPRCAILNSTAVVLPAKELAVDCNWHPVSSGSGGGSTCGLGPELALLLPPLFWMRRRALRDRQAD